MTPCFFGYQPYNALVAVFEDMPAPCVFPTRNFEIVDAEAGHYAAYNDFQFPAKKKASLIKTHSYLQSFKYFPPNVRDQLVFKTDLRVQARALLTPFITELLVGIHVRHVHDGNVAGGSYLKFPPTEFFERALNYFRAKFKHSHVRFLVSSDDKPWCKTNPPFMADSVTILNDDHSAELDFAILAGCQHMIFTIGSYGWWAGYLGADSHGGEVMYYEDGFIMDHVNNANGKVVKEDYFPPHWISSATVPMPE
jgi:galactoside 2-L-fucosyltransferase 1/2